MKQPRINIATLNIHVLTPSIPALAESFIARRVLNTLASARTQQFTKVLADGTELPGNSGRTDHVALIDHGTGLMWAVESLGSKDDPDECMTQEACEARCRELDLLGHTDWRLPTRAELAGLVDDTRHEPAINTDLFPRVKSRCHWTSTPAAWSSASAWSVYFYYGNVSGNHCSNDGFALAVRRAGQ